MIDKPKEKRVFLKHCRKLGLCKEGMKAFGKKHNLSYAKLLKEGLTLDEIRNIPDVRVKHMIKLVEEDN